MSLSYQQRFDAAKPSYIKVNEKRFADLEAGSTVLIPSPQDIRSIIDDIATDETLTLTELRHELATRHGADGTCPVMTGMHLRIVAELVLEALDAGVPRTDLSPVWNVVDPSSKLAAKLPGGVDRINALRETTATG